MGNPLVSVVIPAYNRPDTLKIAIDSVLEQTYPNIEIIICDDSTDNRVKEMINSTYDSTFPIKYYKNERNLYLENWHKCYDLASGDYINYLMDDDVFHQEKIAKMLYFFNEFENITLVTSYRQTIDEVGNLLPPLWATIKLYEETRILDGKILANLALMRILNVIGEPTTVLFRKKDLTEPFGVYQGKQYSVINDLASWLSLLSKGKAVYIPEALSCFRLHPNQNSNKMDIRASRSEWLDLIVSSRKDGFLDTDELYKTALNTFLNRIKGDHTSIKEIARIEEILNTLN